VLKALTSGLFCICIDHENNEKGVHDQKGDLPQRGELTSNLFLMRMGGDFIDGIQGCSMVN